MLARSHGYSGSTGAWSTHNYYHADAGGNITCLINSNNGITAIYRYDPFGRTLFQSGTMANANVYRFSSKEVHGFTGMYYYGFRFYDPGLQRWINRDPIGEMGGLNLYGFVGNSPLIYVDPYGLAWYDWDWIDKASDFCAGAADDLTFGLTDGARGLLGWNDTVDKGGGAYSGGATTAAIGGLVTPAGWGKAVAKKGIGAAGKARAKNFAKGIDPKDLGPSGKPKIHTKDHPTRKRAKDAARDEG
jgi:RHS repeat-associated protein